MDWQTAISAFMQGYQEGELLKQRKAMQQGDMDLRQQQFTAQQEDRRLAREGQSQDRAGRFISTLPNVFAGIEDESEIPQYLTAAQQMAQLAGVRPDVIQPFVPKPLTIKKRQAEKRLAAIAKSYTPDQLAQLEQSGTLFEVGKDRVTLPQLRERVGVAGFDQATGQPVKAPPKPLAGHEMTTEFERFFENEYLPALMERRGPDSPPLTAVQRKEERLRARRDYQQADDRPPRGPDPTISAFREFSMGERLANTWTKANAPVREMTRQLNIMETGLREFKNDPNGGSQAVLVTFQKILDPTSVVRESEYARTRDGQSFLNRLQGFEERLRKGGAGMTEAELTNMVTTARRMLGSVKNWNQGIRSRLDRTSRQYNIDPALVFDDVMMGGDEGAGAGRDAPSAKAPQVGAIVTAKGKRVRVTKVYPDGTFDAEEVP